MAAEKSSVFKEIQNSLATQGFINSIEIGGGQTKIQWQPTHYKKKWVLYAR